MFRALVKVKGDDNNGKQQIILSLGLHDEGESQHPRFTRRFRPDREGRGDISIFERARTIFTNARLTSQAQ